MRSPFITLGASELSTDEEIKKAYLKMLHLFPPELFPEKFKEIYNAYNTVKSKKDRLKYKLFAVTKPTPENFISILKTNKTARFNLEIFLKMTSNFVKEDLKNTNIIKPVQSSENE